MTDTCIFCQIVSGELAGKIVYKDEEITAFWDRNPTADVHILIVPNRHISSMNEAEGEDAELLGKLLLKAKDIAVEQGIDKSGYRLLVNTGRGGGQTIFHLHVHLIGGPHMLAIHG